MTAKLAFSIQIYLLLLLIWKFSGILLKNTNLEISGGKYLM